MIDFVFDGQSLSDHGYMICSFDSLDIEKVPVSSATFNTIKAPKSNKHKKTSINYGDNLTTTLSICKKDCSGDDTYMTADDISEITRWLCRREYKKFHKILDDKDMSHFNEMYYEVQIVANKIVWHDEVLGMELTINNNSPYGYQDLPIKKTNCTSFSVPVYSDEEGWIYPYVSIKTRASGNLILTNTTTREVTRINNCAANEVITFNQLVMQVTSNTSDHDLASNFNYNFPRLLNEYGNYINNYTTNISCDIEVRYQGLRKVGI